MDPQRLTQILLHVQSGELPLAAAVEALSRLPERALGHTRLDTQRALRCGHPEVVFGAGKRPAELVDIARAILAEHDRLLVTRLDEAGAAALRAALPEAAFDPVARTLAVRPESPGEGCVLVASAGTSDAPVAREAANTARWLGAQVDELVDVGVAGLHRLLAHEGRLRRARVIVVVAGLEGALASVVGGLVACPVVAVPTSVGYGASFEGLAALLAMLNSCAAGVSVVNIDNGFGAGYCAAQINRTLTQSPRSAEPEIARNRP